MDSYIFLDNVRFYAYHGVTPQETAVGNEFTISLKLQVDISRAMESDDLADTVNYAAVYEALRAEMSIPSRLLEHVAGRLVQRLFHDFPPVTSIRLRLSKRNPPFGADLDGAGVEVYAQR